MVKSCKVKRLTINLDDYVVEVAREKAKLMFKGNVDYYINWLICNNNKQAIKEKVRKIEKHQEKNKPIGIPNTIKTAMYKNVCDYCEEKIYQGDEICKAEGYKNYIHVHCCKSENKPI